MTYLFKNQIEFLVVFEKLGEMNDVGMTLAVVEGLDLPEYAGASVARNFVDDFDRKLLVRIHVVASLDAGVRALAEYLTSQLIQI